MTRRIVSLSANKGFQKMLRLGVSLGIFIFVIARFAAVYGAFEPYHVNAWIFLTLDLVTAVPYAYAWPKLVIALVGYIREQRTALLEQSLAWGAVVAASFAAPYAYVAVAARNLPVEVVIGFTAFVLVMLVLLTIRLRDAVRRAVPARKECDEKCVLP